MVTTPDRSRLKRRRESPDAQEHAKRRRPEPVEAPPVKRSLTDLPEELLEKIFIEANGFAAGFLQSGELKRGGRGRALWNVCLVSRTFNRIAEPLLYSWYADHYTPDHFPVSRRRFLRTIVQSPKSAARVRRVAIRLEGSIFATHPHEEEGFGDIFAAATDFNDILSKEKWLVDLAKGRVESEVPLLLSLLPNLEELHFEIDRTYGLFYGSTHRLARWLVQTVPASGRRTPLSKLRTLVIAAEDTIQMAVFQDFLGLPSLRSLEIWAPEASEDDAEDWDRAISHVEALTIGPSEVDGEFLKAILGSCKALKNFTYLCGDYEFPRCLHILCGALQLHKNSLEEIEIGNSLSSDSWASFPKLKYLSLSGVPFPDDLAPDQILPPSLKTLCLKGMFDDSAWDRASDFLSDLVAHYRDQFPSLGLVELSMDAYLFENMVSKLQQFPRRLTRANIEVRLNERPEGSDHFLHLKPDPPRAGACVVTSTLSPDDFSLPVGSDRGTVRTWKAILPGTRRR